MPNQQFNYDAIRDDAYKGLAGCGPANKNDRYTALIIACISAGMTNGAQIVGHIHTMEPDLSHKGIGFILNRSPGGPLWHKDPVAGYVLT